MPRMIADSWLREYGRYTKNQESPEMFHLFCAISMISAILDRKVWLDSSGRADGKGYFKIYPNQFIILVARSQLCRKTAAIRVAKDLVMELPPQYRLLFGAQKLTPEALIDAMKPHIVTDGQHGVVVSSTYIVSDELSSLMTRETRNSGILALLVDLYDCGTLWEYRTKSRGQEVLENVYINLLAASSPDYLRLSLPYNEIGGGMFARTLFVYQDEPKTREPFPALTDAEVISKEKLLHDLIEISKLYGPMDMTDEARAWYSDWYRGNKPRRDPFMAEYLAKKEQHVLKIAQVISVAESDSMVIEKEHLEMALKILDRNEKMLPNVMGTLMTSDSGYQVQKILTYMLDLLADGKPITRRNLVQLAKKDMTLSEVKEALETLVAAGMIKEKISEREIYYELVQRP